MNRDFFASASFFPEGERCYREDNREQHEQYDHEDEGVRDVLVDEEHEERVNDKEPESYKPEHMRGFYLNEADARDDEECTREK